MSELYAMTTIARYARHLGMSAKGWVCDSCQKPMRPNSLCFIGDDTDQVICRDCIGTRTYEEWSP